MVGEEELSSIKDIGDLRDIYESREFDYEISVTDLIGAKSMEYVFNSYSRLKSFLSGEDFEYVNEMNFLKDTIIYERAKFEKLGINKEKEAKEVMGSSFFPGYDVDMGEFDVHIRAFVDPSVSEIPREYRTSLTSEILRFREKGFTVLSEEVSEVIPVSHLNISRREYEDFYDLQDKRKMADGKNQYSGSSDPKIYEGLYKPFKKTYSSHLRSKDLEDSIDKDWKEIMSNEEGFALPNKIDSSFLENWYPAENYKKHERLDKVANTIKNFSERKISAGRGFEDVYVVFPFHEIPVLKQYLEDIK